MDGGPRTAGATAPVRLRALRFNDRFAALGLATSYLMSKPAFARRPFGAWSRILTGQVNRGHYVFICDETSVLAFAGWAFASAADAEAWLGGRLPADAPLRAGNCLVINAWAADRPRANDFLLREVRRRASGAAAIYARRDYGDGRSRPVKIALKDRVRPSIPVRAPLFDAPSDLAQQPGR
jgi:hemolysin-activating ACP:hemolysin acyltransferase